MNGMWNKGLTLIRKGVRYVKPMPALPCAMPEPKPLIADFTHRLPFELDLSAADGAVERDRLGVRVRFRAEDGTLFYGGETPILRSVSRPARQRVIVKTQTPPAPGRYALDAVLTRGRRERPLAPDGGPEWIVQPLEETDGQLNYGEFMIGLDASMKCNLACIFCLRVFMDHIHGQDKDMTPEQLRQLAEQSFDCCSGISLSLGAEPTMNKQFDQLVELLGEYPYVHSTMTTNGTTLGGRLGRLLAEKGFKEIHVSLDGATRETVEGIRKGIRFDKVVNHLRALKERKEQLGTPHPRLKMHFAMMARNIHELPQFVDLARELGAAEIRFQHFIIPHESLVDESLWFEPARANQFLNEALAKCREYGIQADAPPPFELEPRPNGAPKKLRTQRCHWPWKGMLIGPEGEATPCCQWKGGILGNVNEEGFEAVWNGEAYKQLRRDWITGQLNEHCRNCSALMEGDVNDFGSFFAAEYEMINHRKPPSAETQTRSTRTGQPPR